MKRNIVSIVVALAMLISLVPSVFAAGVFTDVDSNAWYAEEVQYAYAHGLMGGVGAGEFAPGGNVTRAMVWTVLARESGVDTSGCNPWYLAGQQWAIANGVSDGTDPEGFITREQLVTMIYRYENSPKINADDLAELKAYPDAADVNDWAVNAMAWAIRVGLINGVDGQLQPQGNAIRAQLAVILYRYVETVKEPEAPVGPAAHICAYGTGVSNGDGSHTASCACGNALVEACSGQIIPGGNGTHSMVCNICQTVYENNCSYTDSVCDQCGFVKQGDVMIGEEVYATLADAFAAAVDGDTLLLINDITHDADATITVPSGVSLVLDLNNRSITSETDGTGNREMFLVKGQLTVKNGTITLEHVGTNLGWASMTTIFDVTAGGVLNVYDAAIVNLGGSDMAFCAHLNNWGEVTLNADNAVFDSTYMAIRLFNSGYDMNNLTVTNSVLKGNNYAVWVHNYTEADFGSKYDREAVEGRVKMDIFDNNNTFIVNVAAVRYGFTNSVLLTEDGTYLVSSQAALNSVLSGDEQNVKICLSGNITMANDSTITIPAGKTVALDLNGYTISLTGTNGVATRAIYNKGTLVIDDSVGGGKVELLNAVVSSNNSYATDAILNEGSLTVKGGTIQNNLGGASYAIDNNVGGTTVIEGGSIVNTKGTAIRVYSWSDSAASTLIVNGGQITGTFAVRAQNLGDVAGKISITINGGILTATDTTYNMAVYSWAPATGSHANTSFVITGGEFEGWVAFGGGCTSTQESVSVSGGVFYVGLGRYLADGWDGDLSHFLAAGYVAEDMSGGGFVVVAA